MSDAALADIKVVDFMWVLAGPGATRVLADYGATVLRVESSQRLDASRTLPPFNRGRMDPEGSGLFGNMNAGKLSVALDLGSEEGRTVALDLVRWGDVVTESFSPRAMRAWGLDYASLRKVKSDVIMLSSCLMGQTGPLSSFAGFGNLTTAISGLFNLAGWPDRPPAGPFGAYTDYVAPRFTVAAILAALEYRRRTRDEQAPLERRTEQLRLGSRGRELRHCLLQALVLLDRLPSSEQELCVADPVLVEEFPVAGALLVDPLHQPLREGTDGRTKRERDGHVAIARRPEQADHQRAKPDALRHAAELVRCERGGEDRRLCGTGDGLLRSDVDVLAAARAGALVVRDQGSARRVGAGVRIGLRNAHPNRRPVLVAGEDERPARGQNHEIAVRVAGLGARLAEGRDRHVDERRVQLRHVGVAESPSRERARVVGLDQEVRARDQSLQQHAALLVTRVERDAALVPGVRPPVDRPIGVRLILEERPELSGGGSAWGLDLDHVGTEVTQDLAAQESSLRREIKDAVGAQHRVC